MAYIDVADVAATIHADMCTDNANGYSWSPRWGEDGQGIKKLTIGGRVYQYDRGSYDCSSSVVTACNEALRYTKRKDALKAATYTGNIRSVFVASGLFDAWNTATTTAKRGDIYLNEQNHVAMCQHDVPDTLSEFCINENGEVYGGKVGDQTGREAYIHAYYDFPWDCTLHWKGKLEAADSSEPDEKPAVKDLAFRVSTDPNGKNWAAMGKETVGGSIRWIAIRGAGKYRVHSKANGWLPYVDKFDVKDLEYGCAGDGSPINAVEIPSNGCRYAVRVFGSYWYADMVGNKDTGGSSDTYAGDMVNAIDGFRLKKA